jgi:hypothetical protein
VWVEEVAVECGYWIYSDNLFPCNNIEVPESAVVAAYLILCSFAVVLSSFQDLKLEIEDRVMVQTQGWWHCTCFVTASP